MMEISPALSLCKQVSIHVNVTVRGSKNADLVPIIVAIGENLTTHASMKQFFCYLIRPKIREVVCILLAAALGLPEALVTVQLLWTTLMFRYQLTTHTSATPTLRT